MWAVPVASTRTKDSTSLTKGFIFRPRPCALAAIVPAIVNRSAPVCFWAIPQVWPSPFCKVRYPLISSGHSIPASTSINPFLRSRLSTRLIFRISISRVSAPNCCPPMACRPPATDITFRSLRAARTRLCTSSRDRGCEIPSTRVGLSWE